MLDEIESGGDSSSKNPDDQVEALRQWIEQSNGVADKGNGHPVTPCDGRVSGRDHEPPSPDTEYRPEYQMCITVADECTMKDVRAMLALGNLDALGTILSIFPTREEIDEGSLMAPSGS